MRDFGIYIEYVWGLVWDGMGWVGAVWVHTHMHVARLSPVRRRRMTHRC